MGGVGRTTDDQGRDAPVTVYARLAVDLPAFREALAGTHERCRVEQLARRESDAVLCAVQAPSSLVQALRSDPTVRTMTPLDESGGLQTVQVVVAPRRLTYDALIDRCVILDRIEASAEGWCLDCRFPDEQRLQDYHRVCRGRDLSVNLLSLSTGGSGDAGELTPAQWEVLDAARRHGYYDVPRSLTLQELAAELDLSPQAASERLRRGLCTLLNRYLSASPAVSRRDQATPPVPVGN